MCVLGLSVMCIFFGGCVFQNEYFCVYVFRIWGFPGGSLGKNLPAKAGGWKVEDPLEKEMATHISIPDWEIPWTEEPGGLQSMGSKMSQT